jgi:F0F1-type ATP synthase assembly protein I
MSVQPQPSAPAAQKNSSASPWSALSLVFELGYIIAIPAALFGYFGAVLDKQKDVSPLFLVLGLCIAFALSAYVGIRKIKAITQSGL